MKKIIVFLVFSFLFTVKYSYSQPGSLDLTFDTDGKLATAIGTSIDEVKSMIIQPDGKIIVAGFAFSSATFNDVALARYNSNGSLDNSFDGDGKVITPYGLTSNVNDQANSVALQSDSKIVIAGYVLNGANNDVLLIRYKPNGVIDSTFGTNGIVTTDVTSSDDRANAMLIQPDGKIVIAGFTSGYSLVIRYNSNGTLDTSFDGDGIAKNIVTGYFNSLALQTDGKIMLAGYKYNITGNDFLVARLKTSGIIDSSFATIGYTLTGVGSAGDIANDLAIQPDGKIVVAGNADISGSNDVAVVRYKTDGTLDSSFDTDGKLNTAVGSFADYGNSVELQSDGKIVVGGYANLANADFIVVRYHNDGKLDTSFDNDGKVTTSVGNSADNGYALAIQADGKLVLAGTVTNTTKDFGLARYHWCGAYITSQPSSTTGCANDSLVLTVNANDATSYQWEVYIGPGYAALSDNSVYSGATNDTLIIKTPSGLDGNGYRCIVAGSCGPAVPSTIAYITVYSSIRTDTETDCDSIVWIDGKTYKTNNNTAKHIYPGAGINGCDSIVKLNLTIVNIDNSVTQNGNNLSSNESGAAYQWINCSNNLPISGATSQNYTASANGNYAVIVTKNTCSDTSSCVSVITTGSGNNTLQSNATVFPNPTTGNVSICFENKNLNSQVTIKNILGQVVVSKPVINTGSIELTIPGESGVYFIEIFTGNTKAENFKIIKK